MVTRTRARCYDAGPAGCLKRSREEEADEVWGPRKAPKTSARCPRSLQRKADGEPSRRSSSGNRPRSVRPNVHKRREGEVSSVAGLPTPRSFPEEQCSDTFEAHESPLAKSDTEFAGFGSQVEPVAPGRSAQHDDGQRRHSPALASTQHSMPKSTGCSTSQQWDPARGFSTPLQVLSTVEKANGNVDDNSVPALGPSIPPPSNPVTPPEYVSPLCYDMEFMDNFLFAYKISLFRDSLRASKYGDEVAAAYRRGLTPEESREEYKRIVEEERLLNETYSDSE